MKIGFFQGLALVGMLGKQIGDAYLDDHIDVAEGIEILEKICETLGVTFDCRIAKMVARLADETWKASQDGKITAIELADLSQAVCREMGIDLVDTGIRVPGIAAD